jgi:peptidoglycan/LPS O-acetylase OafA/YrhL
MNPSSPFLVLPVIAMALVTTKLFLHFSRKKPPEAKYKTIDGLRGYLALFVFLHHASIWYFYLHKGIWFEPPSHLYNHFGKTSVSLFFMITGFLFFSKLIESKEKPVDWLHLFVSRIVRLYPVYLLSLLFLLIIIGALSQWRINGSANAVLFEIFQWGTFTVIGRPEINHVPHMENITAGVTWSMIYEWAFYLSLPAMGLIFFRSKVNFFILFLSLVFVLIIYLYNPLQPIHFYAFGAGLAAAFLVRRENFRVLVTGKLFSVTAMLCLVATVLFFHGPYEMIPMTLIAVVFIIISAGNNLLGVLTFRISYMLGQISYPLYLLHPIFLFVVFRFVFGFDQVSRLSVSAFWVLISIGTPVLLLGCFAVHYFIEQPGMNLTQSQTKRIRNYFLDGRFKKSSSPDKPEDNS